MPKILEIQVNKDGSLWVRIPPNLLREDEPITLWTENEKDDASKAQRKRCIRAIEDLG